MAGYRTLVTQVFDANSDCELPQLKRVEIETSYSKPTADLKNDSVFAVKNNLIVDFQPIPKGFKFATELYGKLVYELEHDFYLERLE